MSFVSETGCGILRGVLTKVKRIVAIAKEATETKKIARGMKATVFM
jgi:hypothetical protein